MRARLLDARHCRQPGDRQIIAVQRRRYLVQRDVVEQIRRLQREIGLAVMRHAGGDVSHDPVAGMRRDAGRPQRG